MACFQTWVNLLIFHELEVQFCQCIVYYSTICYTVFTTTVVCIESLLLFTVQLCMDGVVFNGGIVKQGTIMLGIFQECVISGINYNIAIEVFYLPCKKRNGQPRIDQLPCFKGRCKYPVRRIAQCGLFCSTSCSSSLLISETQAHIN